MSPYPTQRPWKFWAKVYDISEDDAQLKYEDFIAGQHELNKVNISMARSKAGAGGPHWVDTPCDVPVIGRGVISSGWLGYHNAYRKPADPVWVVETIGL